MSDTNTDAETDAIVDGWNPQVEVEAEKASVTSDERLAKIRGHKLPPWARDVPGSEFDLLFMGHEGDELYTREWGLYPKNALEYTDKITPEAIEQCRAAIAKFGIDEDGATIYRESVPAPVSRPAIGRQFQHTPGPWTIQDEDMGDEDVVMLPCYLLGSDKVRIVDGDGGLATGYWEGIPVQKVRANAWLIKSAPTLVSLLAEVESILLPLLPDIDPVIEMRAKIAGVLDYVEKMEVAR